MSVFLGVVLFVVRWRRVVSFLLLFTILVYSSSSFCFLPPRTLAHDRPISRCRWRPLAAAQRTDSPADRLPSCHWRPPDQLISLPCPARARPIDRYSRLHPSPIATTATSCLLHAPVHPYRLAVPAVYARPLVPPSRACSTRSSPHLHLEQPEFRQSETPPHYLPPSCAASTNRSPRIASD